MNYRESVPMPRLREYIKLFWWLESDPDSGEVEAVLPDGCPEIVFNLSDRFRRVHEDRCEMQPSTLFAGQMSRRISISPTGNVRLFGIRFHPAGAYPFLRFPLRELNEKITDLYSCIGRDGAMLEERINESRDFAERISIFEDFFLKRLVPASGGPQAISNRAVRRIVETEGAISIAALTHEIGTSDRTLERVFRDQVGIPPKLLARIVRFQSSISMIQNAETPGSLDALLDLGYFDQSHAIRDFREFSGTTPRGFFQMVHGLSDVFTGLHS